MCQPSRIVVALLIGLVVSPSAVSDAPDNNADVPRDEPYNAGWTLHFDNDSFVGRDQQFSGGSSLELAGRRAVEYPWSLDPVLGLINALTRFGRLGDPATRRHSFTLGLAVFTPEDIEEPAPIRDDHPYANLVSIANTRQTVDRDNQVRYKSSFVFGVLGTGAGEALQDGVHEAIGSDEPEGWDNQISDGGELTAQYRVSRQKLLDRGTAGDSRNYDWRYDLSGAVGYITDVSIGTSVRWGNIGPRWWTFDPAFNEYLDLGGPLYTGARADHHEWFVWAGTKARLRLYNAMLEGQLRDSEVSFDRSDLDSVIGEVAVGVASDLFDTNLRGSFEVRARTSELPGGDGKDPVFARIGLSRVF